MRASMMAAVCVVAALAAVGCQNEQKTTAAAFGSASDETTRQPMVRTVKKNTNPLENIFKQTPAEKRQQEKTWNDVKKFVSDVVTGNIVNK